MSKPTKQRETKSWKLRSDKEGNEEEEEETKMAARNKEMDEIRKSLSFMSEELSNIAKQQTMLLSLMEEVKQLKELVKAKDARIVGLERRVDELEQYTRTEDVIITGLQTKHRSYASVAREDGDAESPAEEIETLEMQVITFLKSKNIIIESDQLAACHTLPRRDKNTKPPIIIRFANRKHKAQLMKQGKKLKGTGVYLNEHLTKKNAEIARYARQLKKEEKIKSTWTRNCKVMIKLNGTTPEEEKVLTIRELKDLDQYR